MSFGDTPTAMLVPRLTPILALAVAFASLPLRSESARDWNLSRLPAYHPGPPLYGSIRVFGGGLGGDMHDAGSVVRVWEKGFIKYQPEIRFANNFTLESEGALAGLATGVADLTPAADEAQFTDYEFFYNAFHYDPFEVTVATGGYDQPATSWAIAIIVNKDNPLTGLTLDQLDGIFGAERNGGWDGRMWTTAFARGPDKDIRTWGQLGLGGDWADHPIQTYGFTARNSFGYIFQRAVLHGSDKWNPNYRQYVQYMQAPAGDQAAQISEAMQELSRDKYGIAWASVLHRKGFPQLKVLAVATGPGGPFVPLTPETVQNRTYPLIRNIQVYVNRPPGAPLDPKLKEFFRYILSREGQAAVAKVGYFPLTPEKAREQLRRLD